MLEEMRPEVYLIGLSFLWLLLLSLFLVKTLRHYQKLTSGIEKKDLQSVLEKLLENLAREKEEREKLEKWQKKLEEEGFFHLQKIGLLRYNPFADTGGDQSFVLAILDGKNSGLVISSLHGRDSTRVYAKPVKEGKEAGYELSKEEEEAIRLSLGRKR